MKRRNESIKNVINKLFKSEDFIQNVCLSYRHDFGMIEEIDKKALVFECKEWMRVIINNLEPLDYDISITKEFCETDLKIAYQAGALDMYNEIINTVNDQKLNVLKNKYYEWFEIQHNQNKK
jgi:hypothetical protein